MTESMKLFIIGKEELDFEYMPKDIATIPETVVVHTNTYDLHAL